jgi:hypothetical protein
MESLLKTAIILKTSSYHLTWPGPISSNSRINFIDKGRLIEAIDSRCQKSYAFHILIEHSFTSTLKFINKFRNKIIYAKLMILLFSKRWAIIHPYF